MYSFGLTNLYVSPLFLPAPDSSLYTSPHLILDILAMKPSRLQTAAVSLHAVTYLDSSDGYDAFLAPAPRTPCCWDNRLLVVLFQHLYLHPSVLFFFPFVALCAVKCRFRCLFSAPNLSAASFARPPCFRFLKRCTQQGIATCFLSPQYSKQFFCLFFGRLYSRPFRPPYHHVQPITRRTLYL